MLLHSTPLEAVPEGVCTGDLDVLGSLVDGPQVVVVPHSEPVHALAHELSDLVEQLYARDGVHLDLLSLEQGVQFLVGEQKNKAVDNLMNRLRESKGIGIIKMGAAMRNVLKALRGNQFVAMLCDQDAGSHGVFVDFLGRPASTPVGPASFALRTGACMIAGFILRENLSHHRVILEAPILPASTGDREEDERQYTQAHTTLLEKYVRQKPDHWLWLHRRWKTKPSAVARSRSLSVPRPEK